MVDKSAWISQLNEAHRQGEIASADVEKQYGQAVGTAETQAAEAVTKTKTEAEANRTKIRKNIGTAETQIQSVLNAAREAQQKAQRRQAIGLTVQKVKMPDTSLLATYQTDLIRLRGELNTAEGQALVDIAKQVEAIKADLKNQRQSALEKIGQVVSSNVEAINKAYQAAEAQETAQSYIQKQQADYQAQQIQQASAFQISAVKLNTGEYVDAGIFNDLNLAQQNYLVANGIDKYNKRMAEYASNVTVTQSVTPVTQPVTTPTDMWAQKLPTSEYDEFTQPTEPTQEQLKALGIQGWVEAPPVVNVNPPAYPEGGFFNAKPKTYEFKEMLTIDQKKQLGVMASTGLAITIVPEAGGFDIPIEAVITGAVLAGATGVALYNNREALQHNIGVLGNLVADKQADWQSFANGMWVDANQQVHGFDERTKIWIETELQPWWLKNIAPKLQDMSKTGFPLEETKATIFRNLKTDPIPVPKGVNLEMPRIEDYIYVNPLPQAKKAADDVLMAVAAAGAALYNSVNATKQATEIMPISVTERNAMFDDINKMLAEANKGNIEAAKVWADNMARMMGEVQAEAGSQIDILTRHATAALNEAWQRMATLAEAKTSYVVSLNPTPVNSTSIDNKVIAAVAGYQLAVTAAQNRNELAVSANTKTDIDTYTGQAIMDNYNAIDTGVSTQTKPVTTTKLMVDTIVAVANNVMTSTGIKTDIKSETATQAVVVPLAKAIARVVPNTLTQTQTQTAIQTAVDTLTRTQVKVNTQEATRTAVREAEATRTAELSDTLSIPKIILPLPDGGSVELTQEQFDGIVAWKQGFIYIVKYPNYDKAHTIHTRTPIAGVKYYSGIGSAVKSFIIKNGSLPHDLKFSMGIQDVTISANKPRSEMLDFTLNKNYRMKNANKKAQNNSVLSVLRTAK
jgi:hypothetical protein